MKATLTRHDDGSCVLVQDDVVIGTIKPITKGKDKGRFLWHSNLAIGPKEGVADTQNGALVEMGFKFEIKPGRSPKEAPDGGPKSGA